MQNLKKNLVRPLGITAEVHAEYLRRELGKEKSGPVRKPHGMIGRLTAKKFVPLMTGRAAESPFKVRLFYCDSHLHAIRSGKRKLSLPRPNYPSWLLDHGDAVAQTG